MASAALESARPLVREAEQAQQKLDTSRHEAEHVRRYTSFTTDPLHELNFAHLWALPSRTQVCTCDACTCCSSAIAAGLDLTDNSC